MNNNLASLIYPYHWEVIGTDSLPQVYENPRYYEYRKKWELHPLRQTVADFPLHLDIEATGRCNLMCNPCYRYSRRTRIGDVSMDLFRKIIDEASQFELYSINPSWMGESFLHPQIIDMISLSKREGVLEVLINTNGVFIDDTMAERIIDSGLDCIIFSLDAVTEETYNNVKFGSDFQTVNSNIECLLNLKARKNRHKPRVIVQMIDMMQNHAELVSFIDYWRVRASRVRVATYQSPDGSQDDTNRIYNSPNAVFPCPQLWQRLVISWDGTAYPCIGDNACRMPLGNVRDMSIREIWHGSRLSELRRLHSNYEANRVEMCSHCDLNKIPQTALEYSKKRSLGHEKRVHPY